MNSIADLTGDKLDQVLGQGTVRLNNAPDPSAPSGAFVPGADGSPQPFQPAPAPAAPPAWATTRQLRDGTNQVSALTGPAPQWAVTHTIDHGDGRKTTLKGSVGADHPLVQSAPNLAADYAGEMGSAPAPLPSEQAPAAPPAWARPAPTPAPVSENNDLQPSGAFAQPKTAPLPPEFLANAAAASPHSYTGTLARTQLAAAAADRTRQDRADAAEQQRQAAADEQQRQAQLYQDALAGKPVAPHNKNDLKIIATAQQKLNQDRAAGISQQRATTSQDQETRRAGESQQRQQIRQRDMDWQNAHPDGVETIQQDGKTFYKLNTGHGRYHITEQKPPPGNPEPVKIENLENGDQLRWYNVNGKLQQIRMKSEKKDKPQMANITEVAADGRTKVTRQVPQAHYEAAQKVLEIYKGLPKDQRAQHDQSEKVQTAKRILGQQWKVE